MNLNIEFNNELKENLIETNCRFEGIQYVFKFDNGYGASVVKLIGSYGFNYDQWELAVLNNFADNGNYNICYDTEITDDVLGYLNDSEVNETLFKIRAL